MNWIQQAATDRTRLSENTSFQSLLMLKVTLILLKVTLILLKVTLLMLKVTLILLTPLTPCQVSESLTRVAAIIVSDIDRDGNAALQAEPHLTDFWERMLE